MARPRNKIPSYLPHPASGQARVRVNGRDIYLGPFGSPESKQEYACFIAENFGNGQSAAITVAPGEKCDHRGPVREILRLRRSVLRQKRCPDGRAVRHQSGH